MKKILEKYCLERDRKGLLLLSMPTGFGKTHSILDFIYEHYREFAEEKSKIFFISNLKKNLPCDELKDRFTEKGEEEEFYKHVLRMPSTSEWVIKKILHVNEDNIIPDEFRSKAFYTLLNKVEYLLDIKQNSYFSRDIHGKEYISNLEQDIRMQFEPAFRGEIVKNLKEKFSSKAKRLAAIRENSHYSWIGKLYPAVFSDDKTVLFMSMDKFFLKNTPIVESSYYFSQKLANNSLIFIDEFDSSKDSILNRIIDDGRNSRINFIDLFLVIHDALPFNKFPKRFLQESDYRRRLIKRKGYKWPEISAIVGEFREKSDDIFKKFSMHYLIKSGEDFRRQRNFLFNDYCFHYAHVEEETNKVMKIETDEKEGTNWLCLKKKSKQDQDDSCLDVNLLLGFLNGFFTYFQRGVGYMGENFCNLKKESGARDEFYMDSAVRTVLNHLHIGSNGTNFLTSRIMKKERLFKKPYNNIDFSRDDFYDNGFRCYDIEDDENHDTRSNIHLCDFSLTPDAFLADLCERNFVVGSSATAGIESPLANFDLSYLKSRLGESFHRLQGEDLRRLKDDFDRSTEGYEQIDMKVDFIETDDNNEEQVISVMTELYGDEEVAKDWIYRFKDRACNQNGNGKTYIAARYVRALAAWKSFYDSSCCTAFLCLFTKLCREGDNQFDLQLFREAAAMLVHTPDEEDISGVILSLSGHDFEAQKSQILEDLKAGKRRFVLSSYKTVGAGQNLQYEAPEYISLIPVGRGERRNETDWNGIYLDKPTSLLVNILNRDTFTEGNLFRYIFQLEFLLQNGAISPGVFNLKLRNAFESFSGTCKKCSGDNKSLYRTPAYVQHTGSIILQAIGRICRTDLKSPEILILADRNLKESLAQFSLPDDVIPVKEFMALKEASGFEENEKAFLEKYENRASNLSNMVSHRIVSVLERARLRGFWSEDDRQYWLKMRGQVLRHPTFEKTEECQGCWSRLYAELPCPAKSYYYDENYDYTSVKVHFSNVGGGKRVSASDARLPEIAEIPELKELFVQNKWPLDYPKAELLLLPPVFNNIYKGALGEVCGRCIFENMLHTPLFELEGEDFEIFDYRLSDDIYVDFKLWNDRIAIPADGELEKIRKKMERVSASKVFIVNILGSAKTPFRPVISADRSVFEVPFLCQGGNIQEDSLRFISENIIF